MTVVIDSNILVICLTYKYPRHFIYQQLIKGKFNLAVRNEIIFEYREIISQKYRVAAANAFIALLNELPNVQLINPYYKWQLINTDPDDNKYCDCAIASPADHLVTEDKHFSIVKSIAFPQLMFYPLKNLLKNSNPKSKSAK